MIDIPDGMSDEEFHDFYWSKTDAERVQINRQLADLVKQSRAAHSFTDEEIAEADAKIERHAQVVELKDRAEQMLHKVQTNLELIENRINARLVDMGETASPTFFDDAEKKKSH